MTRREEVLAVINYRHNSTTGDFYVGSIATAGVYRLLGFTYGNLDVDIEEEIRKTDIKTVKKLWYYLNDYIKYMRKYPVAKCPCCGSIVDTDKIKRR